MMTRRLAILTALLPSGCLGVWPGDWQDWLDANPVDTADTQTETACASDPGDCDGYTAADGDCDDDDPTVYPGADEVPYDGIDQDCDGEDLTDVDGDGFDATEAGGTDCDDSAADVNPDAMEIPCSGVDENCDTLMVEDGMTASFGTAGFAPTAVELAWDAANGRAIALLGADGGGACDAETLRYQAFDEGLNLLVDQDITPAVGLGSGSLVAPVMNGDGSPSVVAYSSCDSSVLLLEPVAGDDGEWDATTMTGGVTRVTAVDACSPDGESLYAGFVAGDALEMLRFEDTRWQQSEQSADSGQWSGLDLACDATDGMWVSSVDDLGMHAIGYDPRSGLFGPNDLVHSGATELQGGSGPAGEPWALFFEDAGANSMGYAWQDAPGGSWSLSAIGGVDAGASLDASGAAASGGAALLALIDDGGFHLRRIDLASGAISTWSDTSLERHYADVIVDDQDRAWYLYGSDSAYKVGVLCPE